ncbi:hypothetical protein JKP88DRAFT_307612 [Tribonema minus]|uniref:Transmembrane protein n=1 Tax=Tribonema minus TaxID=303371 RepID=A0A836CI22_9STRA|nr:hypothetical protein JKP88DRAFT_307612 [Tribonema minus]
MRLAQTAAAIVNSLELSTAADFTVRSEVRQLTNTIKTGTSKIAVLGAVKALAKQLDDIEASHWSERAKPSSPQQPPPTPLPRSGDSEVTTMAAFLKDQAELFTKTLSTAMSAVAIFFAFVAVIYQSVLTLNLEKEMCTLIWSPVALYCVGAYMTYRAVYKLVTRAEQIENGIRRVQIALLLFLSACDHEQRVGAIKLDPHAVVRTLEVDALERAVYLSSDFKANARTALILITAAATLSAVQTMCVVPFI